MSRTGLWEVLCHGCDFNGGPCSGNISFVKNGNDLLTLIPNPYAVIVTK